MARGSQESAVLVAGDEVQFVRILGVHFCEHFMTGSSVPQMECEQECLRIHTTFLICLFSNPQVFCVLFEVFWISPMRAKTVKAQTEIQQVASACLRTDVISYNAAAPARIGFS